MAKKKHQKRKKLSEKLHAKLVSASAPKLNPFDLKYNRLKHNVIGKRDKNVGVPGLSKKRAEELRVRSLLVEYKNINRASAFVDKRLGERDPNLSKEEKLSRRFALERSKRFGKRGDLYNLDDGDTSEQLTHKGRSLSTETVGRIDQPISDDELDESDTLDARYVAKLHFGGGDLDDGPKNANLVEPRKSRKEILSEMIARSKAEKYDRAIARDQAADLTDRADASWKELVTQSPELLDTKGTTGEKTPVEADSYDCLLRELQFERRPIKAAKPVSKEEKIVNQSDASGVNKKPTKRKAKEVPSHRSADDDEDWSALFSGLKKKKDQPDKMSDEPPGALKLLAPRLDPSFDPDRKTHGHDPKATRARLKHAVARELRGAKRELRKDAEFLSRVELEMERARDGERKRKTNALMQTLRVQESEHKKMERTKEKLKKKELK